MPLNEYEMKKAIGYYIDGADDHWAVFCPGCGREFEYEGFWDPEDVTKCPCGVSFTTESIEEQFRTG